MKYPRGNAASEVLYRMKRPKLMAQGLNVLFDKLRGELGLLPDGVKVLERDWDNLIILDACRYDSFVREFSKRDDLMGELQSVYSQGPYTNEFLRQNFHGKKVHDTVYVTTSPHLYNSQAGETKEIDTEFHDVCHVWKSSYHPGDTTEAATRLADQYPNKRLIVHYLPPHTPLWGNDLFEKYEGVPFEEMLTGEVDITRQEFSKEYHRNLEIGLNHVETLLPRLSGKTVITADHGQLLGDREFPIPVRGFGHPGLYMDELVKVFWLELPHESRRKIVSEPPADSEITADEEVRESLKELGYLE